MSGHRKLTNMSTPPPGPLTGARNERRKRKKAKLEAENKAFLERLRATRQAGEGGAE